MGCKLPRHRSCRMSRFRRRFRNLSSGCWCIRSWTSVVEEGSVRSCSERGPAGAGPLKEVSRRVDGGKGKRNTLKAARRSMAMAEEEKGQRSSLDAQNKSRQATTPLGFYPSREQHCAPTSSNSSPRLLILAQEPLSRKMLGTPPCPRSDVAKQPQRFVRSMDPCAQKGTWRRGHPTALPDHGHSPLPQYKTPLSSKKPPPHQVPSLLS